MRKFISIILALLLSISVCACSIFTTEDGSVAIKVPTEPDKADNSVSADNSINNESDPNTESQNEPVKNRLEDAKIRLISFFTDEWNENPYLLLAYYGPQEDFQLYFCEEDGTYNGMENIYHQDLENGWRLIQSEEFPMDATIEDVRVKVIDLSTESEPSKILTVTDEKMTKEELEAIGLSFIGDQFVTFANRSKATYAKDYVAFSVGIVNYNRKSFNTVNPPFKAEDFEFFTKDGTSLSELAEGYDYSVELGTRNSTIGSISALFFVNDGNKDKERNKEFCDYLRSLDVYMTYTAEDGSVIRIDEVLVPLEE